MPALNRHGRRPLTRRGWLSLLGIIAMVAVAFAAILTGYNAEGGITGGDGVGATDTSGLIATMDLQTLDPMKHEATFTLSLGAQGNDLVDDSGRLNSNLRVTVTSVAGSQEIKYAAGEPVGKLIVSVPVDGEYASYPFDRYDAGFQVAVDTWSKAADGSITHVADVPIGFQAVGGAYGWDTDADLPEGIGDWNLVSFSFARAFSSQVFAIVLLGLAIIVAILALTTTFLVFTNRRKLEIAFLPWIAGLLFALPLLRSYLPGSPPIGAAIDIFIYLWTIVATVIALVLMVAAWARHDRRLLEEEIDRREQADHAS